MEGLKEQSLITSQVYKDPHNPHLHLERGLVHDRLGFPDLASADAYRALSLLDSVVDPDGCEFHARRKVQDFPATSQPPDEGEDGRKGLIGGGKEDEEDEEDEGYTPITQNEYNALIGPVYALLVKSLVRCGCLRDAYEFALRGLSQLEEMSQNDEASSLPKRVLEEQVDLIRQNHASQLHQTEEETSSTINPTTLKAQGFARRVLYPWNEHEPDRKSEETLQLLNDRLKMVAPKCEVRAIALPALHTTTPGQTTEAKREGDSAAAAEEEDKEEGGVSIQLGLFAKEDIPVGSAILHESSLLTATNRLHDDLCDACNGPLPDLASENPPVACAECDDTIFCSQTCHDQAQEIYHGAVCGLMDNLESIGKDIPDPKDKADYLYLLLLGRALAMAATQDMHPLDLPEVKYIWGDFHDYHHEPLNSTAADDNNGIDATLPFSFQLNILQPMRILEEMELDPYDTLPRYDTWVLNALYAKFRGTASGRLSTWDGGPELCAVHPLWCLANHSCDPNVRWEWGGEITFSVRTAEEKAVWKRRNQAGGEENGGPPVVKGGDGGYKGIRKDEEILNHYCDIGLDVKERREWARGALGGWCLCKRCVWEAGEDHVM